MEPIYGIDKLSHEIFSILERGLLFGHDARRFSTLSTVSPVSKPHAGAASRVRVLSIDAADGGLVAAACLSSLESLLRRISGDPDAHVSNFFDVAAGSGAGGLLAAMLFTRGAEGRPLFTAEEALRFLVKNRRRIAASGRRGILCAALGRRTGGIFRRIFGEATLRETVKPVLIPCYDLVTSTPFVFSRTDAVETDSFDFKMSDVCAAACADPGSGAGSVDTSSVDRRTRIVAVGGGLGIGNPAAVAVTHVLNNRQEFPRATGVEDLLVLSLGGSDAPPSVVPAPFATPSRAELMRIAGRSDADMVDQAVSMAFSRLGTSNYLRIQANGKLSSSSPMLAGVDFARLESLVLGEKSLESELFRGRKLSERTNGERLECFAGELVKEQEARKSPGVAAVVTFKQAVTPRTSCATTATTASTSTSASTSPR